MKKSTISKFFDDWSNKISCCLLSKRIVSESDSLPEERNRIDLLTSVWAYFWRQSLVLPLMIAAIMMTAYTGNAQNIKGIIPVQSPTSGSGVDGDAWAHEPIGSKFSVVGDLFDRLYSPTGAPYDPANPTIIHNINHGLIDPVTGKVLYPPTDPSLVQTIPVTYQIKDNYIDDKTIFTSSNKINDNPNTYTWGPGSSPNKNEIQNCGAHFSYGDPALLGGVTDAAGNFISPTPSGVAGSATDLWCLFAGDRQTINGSSYIDFEFLQASLKITGATYGDPDPDTGVAAIVSGSGAFTTDAPASTGGRTEGDLLVTIQFTQGGGDATVVIQSWANVNGTWQYKIVFDGVNYMVPEIAGLIFCTNNDVTTTVPFDVYGSGPTSGTYEPNQWAEGAINLTQVFKFLDKPCFNISTLFIRTRSSGNSAQSELKDFPGAPIQLNLTFKPDAPTVTSVTRCGPGEVNLLASGCDNGGTLKWFDAAIGGTQVATGGSYSPTITQTTSYWVSCTSSTGCEGPRAEVTGTVITINPGTISGSQTLCTPFDPVAFTSTTDATGNGTITYQWQMNTTGCDGIWNDISGATSSTYNPGAVSVITYFRRAATSTLNSVSCPAYSNCLTVTPNDVSAGTIDGSQTLCTPFNPAAFTSTTAGTGSGTISYQWQSSTTGCNGPWTNITDAIAATYDAPAVSVTTYFHRVTTSTLNGVLCDAISNCLTVTPNAITPGVIAGNQTICSGGNPAAFSNTTSGSGDGSITYQWQSGAGTCDTATFTDIVGATSATYDVPDGLAATTSYRRVATSTLNGVPCSSNSNCITVTVINVTPGTIAADQTICSGGNPAAFTVTVPASGTNLTYQWQSGLGTCATATFTNIVGATSATYDVPAGLTATTSYRRVANSTDAECPAISNCLTVTVNNVSSGSIAGDQTLCSPFNPAAFTSTTAGTGSGTVSYQWQSNTTGCNGTWTNIVDATAATYDAPIVAVTTYFRRVTTSTLNDVQCSANSNCLTVTPNAINPGAIDGSQTGCIPFDPSAFTSTTAASGGGNITYQWQSSTTGCDGTWTNIADATSATYDAPTVSVTTNFRRVATSTLNGVPCSANSNCLTITPSGVNPGEISGSQTLCSPFNPVAFTSTTAGSGNGVITYQWQMSTTGCDGTWSNISGATEATYDAPAVSVVTNFRRVTTSTLNGVPCVANSNCLTVTPNNVTSGSIAGDQTLCSPFDPAAFTSTTAGTGSGTVTFKWQISTTGCDGTWSDIASATSATYDAPAVSVVTNFRRVTTSTLNGVACSANSNCLTVTPNNVTSGSVAGDQKVCIGDDPAAFTSTTAGTGSGVVTYQWQSNTTGCTGVFTDITGATSATFDPGVASVTTYYRRITISTLNSVICSANSNCLTVIAESCAKALCTYTQGYYGNAGGMSCAPDDGGIFGQYTTAELIAKALASYGGTMTIGLPGHSVWISNNATDIEALIAVMPGGGGSYALFAGNFEINNLPSDYLRKGKINNTLLAQTIALGLNIGINGALGDFELKAGMLTTAASEDGCGSDIPVARTCNPDGSVNNEYERYEIKAKVVDALSVKTVQGLFDLANQALGGGSTNGLSLSEIASAVDKINNAFDGCRIFIGYDVPKLVCPIVTTTTKIVNDDLAGFTASPVPFKEQLTIKYDFDYQSDVKIEVFNAQGSKVLSKADTNSYLNKEVTLNLNVNRGQEQVYVVKLTTNRGSSTKKIMSSK